MSDRFDEVDVADWLVRLARAAAPPGTDIRLGYPIKEPLEWNEAGFRLALADGSSYVVRVQRFSEEQER